ncbi:hypothetical protein ANCDUO_10259 [Ancylostoma duodenale]|uniref:Far11/STRP C-terminal domain-containing protein n=1 Tax=Ancylostoma duodenale TaxID=51022 RepID=A0A0C2CRQ0_9BILA|nr:hypothetical protein ANCDUO_10259 [Ancylostoma duodenale]
MALFPVERLRWPRSIGHFVTDKMGLRISPLCMLINTVLVLDGMGDSSNEREGDHDSLKRSVRPNFAEDVYGEKKGTQTEEVEYSESSLAQRRSALLVKLKQLKDSHGTTTTDANVNRAESVDMNDCDIEFDYNDCDTLLNELAELYTYSELDDFASNIQCWKVYADNNEGAYLDFSDEEEVEAGVPLRAATLDKGTGDHEEECLVNAFLNAHLAYKAGAYQALCTLLMAEICEPFDSGLAATTDGGRESKASSRGSRCPSSADLAESGKKKGSTMTFCSQPMPIIVTDRRNRRAATMADNEAMRAVISALYHMVELIRNQDMTEKLSTEDPSLAARRSAFLAELRARVAARRIVPIGRVMARQLAYVGSEEAKDEEIDIGALAGEDFNGEAEGPARRAPELRQVNSGDRTPRAGSPMPQEPPKRSLPWKSKVSKQEIEAFLQQERQKFFSYQLPGDVDTMFALPIPIHRSVETLRKHLYTSIGELQASQDEDYNRYLFSRKEEIEMNSVEELYRLLLPNLCQYVVALLKVLLAAAPSNKAKNDALNILVDVLTPETDGSDILSNSISLDHSTSSPLEESVRLAIDINRHKEIMVKATSSILLLLMKHLRLNHIYQFEYLCQHIVYGNGIPLLLKFLDQNMTRYVQSRYEIHAYNYPQAPLHYVRNRDEWPVLNSENVESGDLDRRGMYYMWRNMFSSINLIR